MNRAVRNTLVTVLLALTAVNAMAASKDRVIDFSGTYKINMQKSKGAPDWRPDTVLVVLQSPYQVHFVYFVNSDAVSPFESHDYVTNGKESKLYAAATEEVYASTKWTSKYVLLVRTRHLVRNEIADTDWTEVDTWTLSDDGKTLTNKGADGKILVYDKQQKEKIY